jgi:drug/metabolite transporter (DMT)-like permease
MGGPAISVACTVLGAAVLAAAQLTGKQAADEMDPVKSCFFRYLLSIPICYALLAVTSGHLIPQITIHQLLTAGLVGLIAWGVGAIVFFTVMHRDSMHRVSPISNSMSVWVAVLSIIFLGEPFFPALVAVLAFLVAGVFLMSPENGEGKSWRWGIPLALLVALLWSVSIVMTKVFIKGMHPAAFVLVKVTAATAFHSFFYSSSPAKANAKGVWLSVASAATLVGGDTLFLAGLKGLPASIATPLYTTMIPFGFLMSIVFLKEKPLLRNWIGMALIFAAAAICGYYSAH